MTDIRVDIDTVSARVRALHGMFDQLETGVLGVNQVQGLQTTSTWTDIPACTTFAVTYTAALESLAERLETTWQRIRRQAEALRDAAAALAGTDERTQQDLAAAQRMLDALVARAEAGPTTRIVSPAPGVMRAV